MFGTRSGRRTKKSHDQLLVDGEFGIPLHDLSRYISTYSIYATYVFANVVIILAITFINIGGNFRVGRMLTWPTMNDSHLIPIPFRENGGGPGPKTGQGASWQTLVIHGMNFMCDILEKAPVFGEIHISGGEWRHQSPDSKKSVTPPWRLA
jgi:hypothetical protein